MRSTSGTPSDEATRVLTRLSRHRHPRFSPLAVLGLRLLKDDDKSLDYGVGVVLFSLETPVDGKPATPGNGVHIAFMAEDPAMVDAFYRVALEHGGTEDGAPSLRPQYNAH